MADEKIDTTAAPAAYTEDAIQTLSSLEHIRLRPGMYIGRMGDGAHPDDGIYILLKEVVDNSIDEFIMGKGRRIDITVADGTVTVRDYGRGIPPGKLVECVSVMNTGGKYNDDVFQFSVGLNGVGTKAVNALSESFAVQTFRDGHFRRAEFSRGVLVSDTSGETGEKDGTMVCFTPDRTLFKNYAFREDYLDRRIWMYAYLNSGLSLYLNGRRFYSQSGLCDLLELESGEDRLYPVIAFRDKMLEFALTHTDDYGERSYSFVNGQFTNDGGTHLSAFKEGVLKAVNEFSGKSYKADDVRDGMIGAVAIKLRAPVFESQTKNKLGNTDVRGWIANAVREAVVDFLHKNPEVAQVILDKVGRNEQMHRKIQEVKKLGKESAAKCRLRIPKLKDCKFHPGDRWPRGTEPHETMIFLTEGDSAAGSIEQSRMSDYQAIFALRGKPLNCFGATREALYKNEEFNFLVQALGIEDDIENLRYDKVVIATDADVDGMHIRNLLITFFLTFFEQLVLRGHLYVLETPLFRVRDPKAVLKADARKGSKKAGAAEADYYCYSEAERDAAAAKLGKKAEITRFKGLGEISPKEFRQFIGEEIKLLPVTLESTRNVPQLLRFYMGPNTPDRKNYIMTNLTVSKYE
ncbi:MAG: type IIA DNA topoisomerase subunit B [Lentisphaeria bacterium]|nr:type IIA DNA topoisomerase subunit B [Lentisphaeria bacterium]